MDHLTLLQNASILQITATLFILIFLAYLGGHRLREWVLLKFPDQVKTELGTINGTLLGLLGLLLVFTFGMANSRYDLRRDIIVEEANNIGTVILRCDLYPDSIKTILKDQLKEYVEARIKIFESKANFKEKLKYEQLSSEISGKVWNIISEDARVNAVMIRSSQMIPALNAMIDITTTRKALREATIPDSIMYFLFTLCLSSAFLLGYDNKRKIDWILLTGFALMFSLTILNIMDLDRPNTGLINNFLPNQKISELRKLF